ncbi:MAG TPA: amidohydrolase family protein [Pseudonocardia sp.]
MATEIVALHAGQLIDGTGADPIEHGVLIVADGVIRAVGRRGRVTVPAGARRVELDDGTLLPGLIDCHTHLGGTASVDFAQWVIEDDRRQAIESTVQMRALMDHGVTTIRDISRNGLQLKAAVNAGSLPGPRIVACGPGLSRTGGHGDAHTLPADLVGRSHPWAMIADGPEQLRQAVRTLNRMGADAIKVWATGGGMWDKELETDQHYDLDELRMVVREAAMVGAPVLAHAESLAATKDCLRAGVATVEHGEELDDECLRMMVVRGVVLVPTLYLLLGPWFEQYPPPPRAGLADYRGETMVEKERNRITDNYTAARQAGVIIATGSDSFSSQHLPFGASLLAELRTMIEVGTPPMDALVAGTANAAKALRVAGVTGTLTEGKSADLLVLGADPLGDPEAYRRENIRHVQRGPQVWTAAR